MICCPVTTKLHWPNYSDSPSNLVWQSQNSTVELDVRDIHSPPKFDHFVETDFSRACRITVKRESAILSTNSS